MLQRIKNLSILSQLLLVFVPILCIYICFNDYYHYQKGINERLERQTEITQNIKDGIKIFIDNNDLSLSLLELEVKERIEYLAKEILDSYGAQLPKADLNAVRSRLKMDTELEHLYIFDKNGIIINTTKEDDLGLDFFSFGASYKQFFEDVMAKKSLFIERVAIETSTKTPMVYAYQAINKRFMLEIGIKHQAVDSLVNDFNTKVENIKKRYKALNKIELFGATETFPSRTINSTLPDYLKKAATICYEKSQDTIIAMENGDSITYHFLSYINIRNQNHYNGHILHLETDNSTEIAAYKATLTKVFWSMLGLVTILFIVIYFLSRQLALPIIKLAKKVKKIEKGDPFESTIISGNAEVSLLNDNFNMMMQSISEHENTLQEKIRDRTQSLEIQNKELATISQNRKLLIREIHHRIKNNLQIISSLLSLELRKEGKDNPADIINNCKNRIVAMGVLHDMLYNQSNYVNVNVSQFLEGITEALSDTIGDSVQIKVLTNAIEVDNTTAIAIGLIANEAITNAIKHGFTGMDSADEKIVTISIYQVDNSLTLKIVNNGKLLVDDLKSIESDSLGMSIIAAFTERLNGEFTFKNNQNSKVELSIIFPFTP